MDSAINKKIGKDVRQMKPKLSDCRMITAMVTPFNGNGNVNYPKAEALAKHLVDEQKSDGLVVCGTTGESPTLQPKEQNILFERTSEAVGDRALIIAGTGSNSTEEAIDMTREAKANGVDATLQVVPYYNKPPQGGLFEHFTRIADLGLPVILYNIPGRCGVNLEPETIIELSKHPNIVAIKECNMDQVYDYMWVTTGHEGPHPIEERGVPDDFLIYTGDDANLIQALELGCQGIVSVASHLIGPDLKIIMDRFNDDTLVAEAEFKSVHLPLIKKLFPKDKDLSNPIMIKAALNLLGWEVGGLRLPLVPATEEEIASLEEEMKKHPYIQDITRKNNIIKTS